MFRKRYIQKQKTLATKLPANSVLEDNEILNLWNDFQKVVKFIDENYNWLNPIMEQVMNTKLYL